MKIIKRIYNYEPSNEPTLHLSNERLERLSIYLEQFGSGETIASYVVDKGHINGLEVHVLKSNRLIYIYNLDSGRLVTVLYARTKQLKRYFKRYPKHLFNEYKVGYNE